MAIRDALLPEFDQEMSKTRATLERVPEGKLDWTPHPKSMTMRALATHLSTLLTWTVSTLENDQFDMAPTDGEIPTVEPAANVQEALARFDTNMAQARTALESATDERFGGPWTLLFGGKEVFTMPRVAVIRSFVMNHMIHHRAQLGVYLRLNDVAVPSIYGPTADESA